MYSARCLALVASSSRQASAAALISSAFRWADAILFDIFWLALSCIFSSFICRPGEQYFSKGSRYRQTCYAECKCQFKDLITSKVHTPLSSSSVFLLWLFAAPPRPESWLPLDEICKRQEKRQRFTWDSMSLL
jgi:hypothetical protein